MARESVEEKGRRYVAEGRLVVLAVDARIVRASCRGGGAVYDVGFDGEAWSCSCPALRRCSHLVATQLVTVREPVVDREPAVARAPTSGGAALDDADPEPRVCRPGGF